MPARVAATSSAAIAAKRGIHVDARLPDGRGSADTDRSGGETPETTDVGIGERSTREAGVVHAGADGRLSYKVSGSYYTQEAWARLTTLPDGTALPPYASEGTTQYKGDVRVDWIVTESRVVKCKG